MPDNQTVWQTAWVLPLPQAGEGSKPAALLILVPDQLSDLCFGMPLVLVEAILSSSFSLIDLYIEREGPLSDPAFFSPRFAESAAPAAYCCALDFAGI